MLKNFGTVFLSDCLLLIGRRSYIKQPSFRDDRVHSHNHHLFTCMINTGDRRITYNVAKISVYQILDRRAGVHFGIAEESISAHAGFHALLSVFTFPQFEDFISLLRNASVYEAMPESSIVSVHNGPPVPPPLK